MAQNITLMGASYSDVPAVTLPKTGGGTAEFFDARTVTYSLSGGASVSANPSNAIAGQGFSVKLKAPAGYNLSNVTVTMGGVDITSQVFEYDEGGGGPSATQHSIYFEFTDNTNTTITGYWDDSFISNAITATTPTTYGVKTVSLAQLDGVTWYTRPTETWETIYDNTATPNADTPYNYWWLSSLSDVYPTLGSVWRVTIDGTSWVTTARQDSSIMQWAVYIGNPKYSGGQDDGSGMTTNFYNAGWGAWTGDTEVTTGVSHTLKIERQVSA